MMQEAAPVREKWKFNGRQLIDGIPHLVWAFDESQVEVRGRHRAEAPDWEWGCPVDAFRDVTLGRHHAPYPHDGATKGSAHLPPLTRKETPRQH